VQAGPLLGLPEVARELVSFAGTFLTAGAVGFRYAAARRGLAGADAGVARAVADAARRAAVLGLVGAVVRVALLAAQLPEQAARAHVGVAALVVATPMTALQLALMLVLLVGFALAVARVGAGWALAALGVVGIPLRGLLLGEAARVVNPVHMLAGGLWIGTLFVLVAVGIPAVLRSEHARGRRDAAVAEMVNGFSPLALGAAATLATFGAVTAWRHLPAPDALWTTPYGRALCVKLALVAGVVALGAWNWRRVRPRLGTAPATAAIRRSAAAELAVAGAVLLVTAVLVSLPAPPRPEPPPPTANAQAGAPAVARQSPGSRPVVAQ
jgi:copper transport protein